MCVTGGCSKNHKKSCSRTPYTPLTISWLSKIIRKVGWISSAVIMGIIVQKGQPYTPPNKIFPLHLHNFSSPVFWSPVVSKKLSLLVIVNWGESRREGCSKNVRKVVPPWVNGARSRTHACHRKKFFPSTFVIFHHQFCCLPMVVPFYSKKLSLLVIVVSIP